MRQLRKKAGIRRLFREHADAWADVRLCFLVQDWDDGYNVGGLFRVADAVGAEEIVLTGGSPVPGESPTVGVTSMGAHRRVAWRQVAGSVEAARELKGAGWTLVAVEVADGALPHNAFAYPPMTCLVLGAEGAGVYERVLRECEASVFVPMTGKGRSLNVHVAAAIVAFEARLARSPEVRSSEGPGSPPGGPPLR